MQAAHDRHGAPITWNAEGTMGTSAHPVWWWTKGYRWPDRDAFLAAVDALADS